MTHGPLCAVPLALMVYDVCVLRSLQDQFFKIEHTFLIWRRYVLDETNIFDSLPQKTTKLCRSMKLQGVYSTTEVDYDWLIRMYLGQ